MNVRRSPLNRRLITQSYANPRKAKGHPEGALAFAGGRPRLFLFGKLAQHSQRLNHGLGAHLAAPNIAIFSVMRDKTTAA